MLFFEESDAVDPIDEIDGKKKRRTMLENMQRSSSLFQSKMSKSSENKAAEKAQEQVRQSSDDSTQFSSEFTNQDTNLNSGQNDLITNWEDILEDDDWLTDEGEDEDPEEGGSECDDEEWEDEEDQDPFAQTPPPEWKPAVKKSEKSGGGFFNSSFGRPAPPPAPKKAEEPEVEEAKAEKKLGFEWGPVQTRKPDSANPETPPIESAEPEPVKQSGFVPFSATRKGGWQSSTPPAVSPRIRPVGKVLPPRGQLQEVDDALVRAAQLLIATPEDEPGYEECIRLLGRFGLGAIRICNKAKVKIHILDETGFSQFQELVEMGLDPEEFPVDGAYLVKSRVCLIARRCLTEKPRFFHPALYYFAHALDHAQGGDDFSSRKAAAVVACFESSASGYNGADFVDELAATDPVRYFARAVAIYLGRDDCDEPIWTHQDLFDFDRSMYDYLQYLFGRFST